MIAAGARVCGCVSTLSRAGVFHAEGAEERGDAEDYWGPWRDEWLNADPKIF